MPDIQLEKNFMASDFVRPEKGGYLEANPIPPENVPMDPGFMSALQGTRDYVNSPMVVSPEGGFRPQAHPREKDKFDKFLAGGGDPATFEPGTHVQGKAADVNIQGLTQFEQAMAFERNPAFKNGGIGIYDTHIHVDTAGTKARRWAGHNGGSYEEALKKLPGYDPQIVALVRAGKETPVGFGPYAGPPEPIASEESSVSYIDEVMESSAMEMLGLSPNAQGEVQMLGTAEQLLEQLSIPGQMSRSKIARFMFLNRGQDYAEFPDRLGGADFLNLLFNHLGVQGPNGPVDFNESALKNWEWDKNRPYMDQVSELADMGAQEFARQALIIGVDVATDPLTFGLGAASLALKGPGLVGAAFTTLTSFVRGWGQAKAVGGLAKEAKTVNEYIKYRQRIKESGQLSQEIVTNAEANLTAVREEVALEVAKLDKIPRNEVEVAEAGANMFRELEKQGITKDYFKSVGINQPINNIETAAMAMYHMKLKLIAGEKAGIFAKTAKASDRAIADRALADLTAASMQVERFGTVQGLGLKSREFTNMEQMVKDSDMVLGWMRDGTLDSTRLLWHAATKCVK